MSSDTTPCTVLVTGAARGIGRAIALHLAGSGWLVYAGVRDQSATDLATLSDRIRLVTLDVTDEEQVQALDGALPERLDAVVNNVGIAVPGPVETLDRAALHRQFDVNLFGPLAVTRAVLPRLRAAGGRIVFMSSVNGLVSFPFTGAYNASKFALEAIADCLRVELWPWGLDVVLIEPGVVDTDPWHEMEAVIDAVEAAMTPEHRQLYAPHLAGERGMIDKLRRGAAPPQTVALAVERVLTQRRPPARVVLGRDARMLATLRAALPAKRLDAVWVRSLRLPAPARAGGREAGERRAAPHR